MKGDCFDLIAIGAGPKTAALFIRIATMPEDERAKTRILAIERNCVGGNWLPSGGLTTGDLHLGTSPEKDLVYPNVPTHSLQDDTAFWRREQYTWKSFLTEKFSYSNWIDMGMPRPTHYEWACYIRWATEKAISAAPGNLFLMSGDVSAIHAEDNPARQAKVEVRGDPDLSLTCNAVMVTGPGSQRPLSREGADLPQEAAWRAIENLAKLRHVVLAGGGESTGTFAKALLSIASEDLRISIVAPQGLQVRQESFLENRFYSDAAGNGWSRMTRKTRREFCSRSDSGVCSASVRDHIMADKRVLVITDRVVDASVDIKGQVSIRMKNGDLFADALVNCTGFSIERRISELLHAPFASPLRQLDLGDDFAISTGPFPIVAPALATQQYGPGFANLSCLGTLAEIVANGIICRAKGQEIRQDSFTKAVGA